MHCLDISDLVDNGKTGAVKLFPSSYDKLALAALRSYTILGYCQSLFWICKAAKDLVYIQVSRF